MIADLLIKGIGQLATPAAPGPARGTAMGTLRIVERAAIAIVAGRIAWYGPARECPYSARSVHDCGGAAVVPGLIDPHTHAVWSGDRLADFEARSAGVSYEQILAGGGGIRSTIRQTAAASMDELVASAAPRIASLVRSGASTIEVKSGYGFEVPAELRMLEAIQCLKSGTAARLIPTLLIHIPPADAKKRAAYAQSVREELIPEVARRSLATAVDVFVEQEAWSAPEAAVFLEAAEAHALRGKLHTEQFHRVGGLELGIEHAVQSVDHLEASAPEQWTQLAESRTVATILPGVTLHLGIPAAPGRRLIDAGAVVAVGTDLNPGSSPLFSTAAALGLAVRLNGLTPAEALTAGTANAAAALGLDDCGGIHAGFRADLLVLDGSDWRELVYALGRNPVRETWIAGKQVQA